MHSKKLMKSLLLAALFVGASVFQSQAQTSPAYYTIDAGTSFSLYVCKGYSTNNPNGYPVVSINGGGGYGFLLDGSDMTKEWFKMLQDAVENGKRVQLGVDNNDVNGYSAECVPTSGIGGLRRVYGVTVFR